MAFQQTVPFGFPTGVPGAIYDNSPIRALAYQINDESGNTVVGHYFTMQADGTVKAGGTDATQGVGILFNPHSYVNYNANLAATQVVASGAAGQFLTFGRVWVRVADASKADVAFGAPVCFDATTGELKAGTATGTDVAIPGAKIIKGTAGEAFCVIELS